MGQSSNPSAQTDRVIMGVDPGTQVAGYGVLSIQGKRLSVMQYGVIHLGKYSAHETRLKKIFDRMVQLIDEFHPDEMALEAPFYGKNVQSMLKLGRAQGVAMAAALSRQVPITEYAPKKVKQSVTGNGNASKEQVAQMLAQQFDFTVQAEDLHDATDGLAVAVCHYYQNKFGTQKASSWSAFLRDNPDRIR